MEEENMFEELQMHFNNQSETKCPYEEQKNCLHCKYSIVDIPDDEREYASMHGGYYEIEISEIYPILKSDSFCIIIKQESNIGFGEFTIQYDANTKNGFTIANVQAEPL